MPCQLTDIRDVLYKGGPLHRFLNDGVRMLRTVKKRIAQIMRHNAVNSAVQATGSFPVSVEGLSIRAGDLVRVKTKKKIRRLLDAQGKTRGCAFTYQMYRYCGRVFRVLKSVEFFFDETRQRVSRCSNMVILEGAVCSGRQRLYMVKCDRNCHFFWQIEWLEKAD